LSKVSEDVARTLGNVVSDKAGEVADLAKDGVIKAIENMDERYAKETLATIFPVLSQPVKLLIALLVAVGVILSGIMAYEVHLNPTQFDIYDLVAVSAAPFIYILLLAAIPIKSLAHGSAALGAELLRQRIQNHSERPTSSGVGTDVPPDTIATADADKHRTQTHSEHTRA